MDIAHKRKLRQVIKFLENTTEDQWCIDVVRTKDQKANCLFGHLFAMGKNDKEGNKWWTWFEENIATTYMVYPVNDGKNAKYQQPTPKQRCIAYLKDLDAGIEYTTPELMEIDYQAWKNSPAYQEWKLSCLK